MTLFIAILLIYHFDMDWWWYAIAVVIWIRHVGLHRPSAIKKYFKPTSELPPQPPTLP